MAKTDRCEWSKRACTSRATVALIAAVFAIATAAPSRAATEPAADSTIALPATTGPHSVGTFSAFWIDSARSDTTARGVGRRAVNIQAWYPTSSVSASVLAVYAPGVDTSASEYGRLMARVRGHAFSRPPFATGVRPAPMVVFSTGRSMAAYDYSAIAEDLASHGYVVIGVNSPRLSRFATAEGEVIPPAPAPPPKLLQHFDDADAFFERMIEDVAADLRFVVRRLENANRSDPILAGHLDLARLAMMGHSNGALAASRACAEEKRCRACLDIEGTQAREIRKNGVSKPFGLLISDRSLGFDTENVYRELGTHRGTRYTVMIVKGAGHNSATDLLLIRPKLFDYAIEPAHGVDIARVAIRGFFDEVLRAGNGGTLKTRLARFPEVEAQSTFGPGPNGTAKR